MINFIRSLFQQTYYLQRKDSRYLLAPQLVGGYTLVETFEGFPNADELESAIGVAEERLAKQREWVEAELAAWDSGLEAIEQWEPIPPDEWAQLTARDEQYPLPEQEWKSADYY